MRKLVILKTMVILFLSIGIAWGSDLVADGGLESGTTNYWSKWGLKEWSIVNSPVRSGSFAAKLFDDAGKDGYIQQKGITISPQETYIASAWVYDNDPDGEVTIRVDWYTSNDGSGSSIGKAESPASVDTPSYQELMTGEIVPPANANSANVRVWVSATGASGNRTVYVDDISFLLVTTAPEPIEEKKPAKEMDVAINEIAWMGTIFSSSDEWIELYNNTNSPIDLTGWSLRAADGAPDIFLAGIIPAKSYFLLERTDDETVKDIKADQIYTGALEDKGEDLQLRDAFTNLIDSVLCETNGSWFAGEKDGAYTMERIDPRSSGNTKSNWHTNNGIIRNNTDGGGNLINGTPKAKNSEEFKSQPEEKPAKKVIEVTSSPFFPYRDINGGPTEGKIKYNVPGGSRITLRIFDVRGKLVKVLLDQEVDPDGQGSVAWDGTDGSGDTIVPIGIYICHIEALNENTGKVTRGRDKIVIGRKLK
jgi:hypothetical protein